MPRLTLVMERKPLQVYDLNALVTTIGRGEDMQIRIDNVSVSRRQAQIRLREDGRWIVEDPGSGNGTFLNGARVTEARALTAGDEISFGKFSLFFDTALAEPVGGADLTSNGHEPELGQTFVMKAEDVERLQQAAALKRRAQLQWEAGGERGTFSLDAGAALVGRADLCDLRVPGGPKHHVLVMRTKAGFEVRNLSRWYRMQVNGRPSKASRLKGGDVVEVGGLCLTFLDDLAAPASRRTSPGAAAAARQP